MKRLAASLALVLVATPAFAYTPATGLWFDPLEPGSGFDIDVQDDTMVVAAYTYDAQGAATWFLATGQYDESTGLFSGALDGFTDGQCLGCTYVAPTYDAGAGGQVEIDFTDFEDATLTFNGQSIPLQHYNYGYNGKDGYLLGQWLFSVNINGVATSQWIDFDTLQDTPNGIYVTGHADGTSAVTASSHYDPTTHLFTVTISNGTQDNVYELGGTDVRLFGSGWIEPTGVIPTTGGDPAFAARILSPTELLAGQSASSLLPARGAAH